MAAVLQEVSLPVRVEEIDTGNRKHVRRFLALPHRIYRNIPKWTPPLEMDARKMLDRRRNPFFRESEAAFFLAVDRRGYDVGRIAVLDNRRFNEFNHARTAFYYLFECENHAAVSHCLFEAAFAWARARGLETIVGPRGFTVFDGFGLLVKGFEHRPAFGLPYHPDYYQNLVEAAGFKAIEDSLSGYLHRSAAFPEKILRASELIQKRRGLKVVNFRTRADLRRLIPRLQELYNSSLGGTTGMVPLNNEEVQSLADQMLWFADPRLIKIIYKDDRPIGFLFAYPDISAALQRTRGKLLPFGWIDLLLEFKRTNWVNINGAGIVEEYRGLGGTAILFAEMYKSIRDSGFEHADIVQIGVENDRMQRELEDLGIDFYKVHRIYEKSI
jgi:hypothetical protein